MTLRRLLLLWQVPFWALLLVAYLTLNQAIDSRLSALTQANQTRAEAALLERVLQTVVDMETGVRGYVITGNEEFLQPYQQGRIRFPNELAQLRAQSGTLTDPAAAQRDLDVIENLTGRWLVDVAEPEIASERAGEVKGEATLLRNQRGKALIDRVRQQAAQFGQREAQHLARQEETAAERLRHLRLTLLLLGLGLLGVSVAFVWRLNRMLQREFQAVNEAAARMAAGQKDVQLQASGTREFRTVSQTFNVMSGELGAAQAEAQRRTDDLSARNAQMRALGELSDWLQAARNLEEGGEVLARALPTLLPGTGGLLMLHNASRNLLTPLLHWNWPSEPAPSPPDHCWALRRGEARFPGEGRFAPPCLGAQLPQDMLVPQDMLENGPARGDGTTSAPPCRGNCYLCFPLFSHGETLGVLRLITPPGGPPTIVDSREELRQLLVPLTRQVGLALSALQLQDRLLQQSLRDPLTGLANRRHLEQELEKQAALSASDGAPLSCIAIDVDHFKRLNDTFGHDAGDAVLVRLGTALRELTPPGALAARPGGEEFCLLLPDFTAPQAAALAERLRAEVAGWTLAHAGIALGQVTVSQGVAGWDTARDPTGLIKQADEALYRSKAQGRNRVTLYAAGPSGAVTGPLPATENI